MLRCLAVGGPSGPSGAWRDRIPSRCSAGWLRQQWVSDPRVPMACVAVPTPAAQASSMLARARRDVRGRAADEAPREM